LQADPLRATLAAMSAARAWSASARVTTDRRRAAVGQGGY